MGKEGNTDDGEERRQQWVRETQREKEKGSQAGGGAGRLRVNCAKGKRPKLQTAANNTEKGVRSGKGLEP